MFQFINYIRSYLFSQTIESLGNRSGQWQTIRKKHLIKSPTCAACGGAKKLSVHHCVPFHLDEAKELDPENLITLCEENNCHRTFGHFYSWFSYNPNVREDAASWLEKVKNRPKKDF